VNVVMSRDIRHWCIEILLITRIVYSNKRVFGSLESVCDYVEYVLCVM